MRHIFLTLILLAASFCAAASNPYKQFEKIIAECDVADAAMNAPDAVTFWTIIQMTNKDYAKTAKSLASKGDKDLKREMVSTLYNCDYYFRNVPTRHDLYEFSESIVNNSGLRGVNPFVILSITQENDIASFSYPNGYIFLTEGLYEAVNGDAATIEGIFAAEAAHYVLQHAYAHSKWEKSRRHRTKFWRIFGAAAITAASVALDQIIEDSDPYSYSPIVELGTIAAISLVATDCSPRYTMLYTPRQIYEADIIAYRFLEWSGRSGRAYIDALHRIGYDIDAANPQGKDCPSVSDRIALLEYMAAHPELRAKVKASKRRPKSPAYFNDIFRISQD